MNNVILGNILIICAIILTNLLVYGLKRKSVKGASAFVLLMAAMVIHTLGYAFELFGSTIEAMYKCIKVEYIGASFYPTLILLFAKECVDDNKYIRKPLILFAVISNLITLAMVYTNEYHNLYYSKVGIDNSYGFNILELHKGSWYYYQMIMLVFVLLYSMFVLYKKYRESIGTYKKRLVLIMLGFTIPLGAFIISIMNINKLYIDLLPFSYLPMSIVIAMGFYLYNPIFFIPVTYERIFNSIDEAVIVIDNEKHIINFNDSTVNYFESFKKIKVGDYISSIDELIEFDFKEAVNIVEIGNRVFRIKVLDIGSNKGTIYFINDITIYEKNKKQLQKYASEDGLTGLFNRRIFMEKYYGSQKGVFAILDIDHFKSINDTYGHSEGDQVLEYIGKILRKIMFEYTICRYGGEEFALFSEEKNIMEVKNDIIRLRNSIKYRNNDIKLTFSAGITTYDEKSKDDAIVESDKLMYLAKKKGRNQIEVKRI